MLLLGVAAIAQARRRRPR
ncbi:hypothetical protein NKH18_13710 [Streptomyces sp. M10(2022)]